MKNEISIPYKNQAKLKFSRLHDVPQFRSVSGKNKFKKCSLIKIDVSIATHIGRYWMMNFYKGTFWKFSLMETGRKCRTSCERMNFNLGWFLSGKFKIYSLIKIDLSIATQCHKFATIERSIFISEQFLKFPL